MTVGRDYMLKKEAGPSGPKLFLDTKVLPVAANMAGRVELGLDRAAGAVGVRPMAIVAGVAAGLLLSVLASLRNRRAAVEPSTTSLD